MTILIAGSSQRCAAWAQSTTVVGTVRIEPPRGDKVEHLGKIAAGISS